MGMIILFASIGLVLGLLFAGGEGGIVGAFLGVLTGKIAQQQERLRQLQTDVGNLNQMLHKLRNDLAQMRAAVSSPTKPNESTPAAQNALPAIQQNADAALNTPDVLNQPSVTIAKNSMQYYARLNASSVKPQDPIAEQQQDPSVNQDKEVLVDLALPEAATPPGTPQHSSAAPQEKTQPSFTAPLDQAHSQDMWQRLQHHKWFALLMRGNPIVRIGMVVLFFGLSFLVKYAANEGLLPIQLRLTVVGGAALLLLVVGWRTRLRAGAYGLVLQGGALGIFYLTLFAAAKIYGLMPLSVGFFLLFLIVIFGVVLAVVQNAQVLAILATAGGFMAPILTSTGQGSHVALFSFYLILNSGILAIALYKTWRQLNWIGFLFTFVIATAWGVLKYQPEFYASTQPFLIAFFALYLTVAILFSLKQSLHVQSFMDASLVFGLPLIAFTLQATLLHHTEYGLAISASVLGFVYACLAFCLKKYVEKTPALLIEAFIALAVGFFTLAIPLALGAHWTSIIWGIEAAGLVWVGVRQARPRPRLVGYLLYLGAVVALVLVQGLQTGSKPLISGDFFALSLLALSGILITYVLDAGRSCLLSGEKYVGVIAMSFGLLWWMIAGINEINAHLPKQHHFASSILFATLTAAVFMWVQKPKPWARLHYCVFSLMPFVAFYTLYTFADEEIQVHPLQGIGAFALLIFIVTHLLFLRNFQTQLQGRSSLSTNAEQFIYRRGARLLPVWHLFSAWLIFGWILWESLWIRHHFNLHGTPSVMVFFASIFIPLIFLSGLFNPLGQPKPLWPTNDFSALYRNWVPLPAYCLSFLWFLSSSAKTLSPQEFYLPLFNWLDLMQLALIGLYVIAYKQEQLIQFISARAQIGLIAVLSFVWLNVVVIRALSRHQEIPYNLGDLWHAMQIQMALSVLWSLCALLLMLFSRLRQERDWWVLGAALLGAVVVKLFLMDLNGTGTLTRIVSFLVVGGLMLLIGFFAPIPTRKKL